MASKSTTVFLLLLIATLLIPPRSLAQEGNGTLISNVFINTDLGLALEDLAAQAGVNIITDINVSGVVSVELKEVDVDKALELLLAGTEFLVHRTPDYYLVYAPDETSDIFPTVAETRLVRVFHVPAEAARNMLPSPLQRYVRTASGSDVLAITAPQQLLGRILSDLAKIDASPDVETRLVTLRHVKAASARGLLPENLQRFVRTDEDRNALGVSAPTRVLRRIEDQLAKIDVPFEYHGLNDPRYGRTRILKLDHVSSDMALSLLPAQTQDYVRAHAESNTLSINAPDNLLSAILSDIAAIDVPREHVMLDARVVVLSRVDLLDFGVEWSFPTATTGTFINDATGSPRWPWELRIGYTPGREFTDALSLTLNLLTQNNEATIIASPKVLAQDGKEAQISITTEEFFEVTAESDSFIRAQLEKIETGTILFIKPRVGPKGDLTLDMQIEVSDVIARGEQNLPVVSRRTAQSTVQIESGGTAAIAGLVDTRTQLGRSGVPGASRLPLLGRLFRADEVDHRARQVAVFVTATVVRQGDDYFDTGRRNLPPIALIDEDIYRQRLEAVLDIIEAKHP